jgi:hypothetical protein
MAEKSRLVPRALSPVVAQALRDTPVVFLGGPRQSGKSTLAQRVAPDATYTTLDDAVALAAASADPDGFVAGLPRRAVIDEVQRVPSLFRAIKSNVDRDRKPGRFLLTGSGDVLAVPRVSESLAGRIELLTLWPFAEVELEGTLGLVDSLFEPGALTHGRLETSRAELTRRMLRGGFPEIQERSAVRRGPWFDSYVATITQRDVRDLAEIRGLTELPRLLRLLAARTASVLNIAELSRSSGIAQTTLARYLSLLEATYLLRRIPAWSGNLGKRLLSHPKIVLADTGLAAHLQGVDEARLASDPHLAGPLLENFVVMELHKQISWSRTRPDLYHVRSVSGDEVDVVLERPDGTLVGIETKAGSALDAADFRGLRMLADKLGRKFLRGFVLYTGAQEIAFGRQLHAVPIAALWR